MTLLEALAALAILGASAAGFLGVFQNAARSMQSANTWNQATAVAQEALERSISGGAGVPAPESPGQYRVDVRPWSTTVNAVVVEVELPDGRRLTVHRLVRQR